MKQRSGSIRKASTPRTGRLRPRRNLPPCYGYRHDDEPDRRAHRPPQSVQRIDRFVRRIQTEGFQPGPDAIANFEVALECLERADYPGGKDAMIWGEYGLRAAFSPASRAAADWQLIERFERLRVEE